MLNVDLGTLARQHRTRVDVDMAPDDALWEPVPWPLDGPVAVRLEAQYAATDVLVRGTVSGAAALSCRRCLEPVHHTFDEELTLLYKAGLSTEEAELAEVYALPARAQTLDLAPAVVEHVLLAVPEFVNCDEACRGLCARCGTNLNQASCDCVVDEPDPRWATLRRLGTE